MKTFSHLATMSLLRRYAVFCIPTRDHGEVWMRISEGCTNQAVVEVDAQRFLAAWRQAGSGYPEIAHQTIDGWRHDYKFDEARKGFDEGWSNPVPLAYVTAWLAREPRQPAVPVTQSGWGRWLRHPTRVEPDMAPAMDATPGISFTNGITRTIWLLAARAERFPVSCSAGDATLLHQLVGADDTEPHLVVDLIPPIDHLARLNENDAYRRKLAAHGLPEWLG
ncbi:plasmid fertility inhibition factor family protein [Burkholderia gladioli]|uniref:plasmid fertility inhibition factor family protein n=1 Tax=Burkholderia gladioli TaxID=28095 RepID=UPI001C5E20B3|nr:hypothetical protein [Burkholderia gladioli]MBW5286528.1 hypothetical protein [Burkholderia gladioli]